MKRGRKPESVIRQNIVEIIYFLKMAHGYGIYKVYRAVFPRVALRSIYYHLKKGAELGELRISSIKKVAGEFSWGGEAEKVYYEIGPNAKPVMSIAVREYLMAHENKNVFK